MANTVRRQTPPKHVESNIRKAPLKLSDSLSLPSLFQFVPLLHSGSTVSVARFSLFCQFILYSC